ncbi:ROK family transcriptional regulator [Paenibacillus harenae]|uniref:Glucokinase-like ROK family protein n=1 Tax=Paenibacillus harenae TaxID=306543 RepID=A0ABT9U7T2_PAEHA|nr:ROK family transcriptional regulator [Paenibacillus harenae]MDQ0115699.1 glucokinase-like ROK family protein [Paenibacillus harenae]
MKIDKSVINTINKKNVLSAIRASGQVFKAEIARSTGLSIPTVMKITDELIGRGLVREAGKGESSGGKPPQLLEFVADRHYIVGVDIGTTNILCILMDMSANILYEHSVPTMVKDAPEQIIDRVAATIEAVIAQAGVEQERLLGIGLGMPGLLDYETGTVLFSPDFHWERVELLSTLKVRFALPMVVHNVTHSMAMAQKWFGYGRDDINSFICVNLGHGIGSALFLDGELFSGGSGSAGELGHMTMEKDGPLCVCGNPGCLEALASGDAIARRALAEINAPDDAIISKKAYEGRLEAKDVFEAADRQNEMALRIIANAAEYIGLALAKVINLLDPEMIVLEGGLSRAGAGFITAIHDHAQRYQMKYAGRNTRIVVSELAEHSAAIGSATFLIKRLFDVGGDQAAM